MPATAEVLKPGVLCGFLYEKGANFRPRLKEKAQGGEDEPPPASHSLRSSRKTGLISTSGNKSRKRTGGVLFHEGCFVNKPYRKHGHGVWLLCFGFCSFSPCPAKPLWTHEAKEPLTCLAAPALPSLLEHAGRLQQLQERGQVLSFFSPEPGGCGRVRLCAWACHQR